MKKSKRVRSSFTVNNPNVSIKRYAIREEQKIAKETGGTLQPKSGGIRNMPGDMRLGKNNLVEIKSTKSKQFIISEEILSKIEDEAMFSG